MLKLKPSQITIVDIDTKPIEVSWLPSLPLTRKYKAPPICGLGVLYSEELDRILQVFETDNLKNDIKRFSRAQAAALNIDPNCRVHWLEVFDRKNRAKTHLKLLTQMQTG